MLTSKSSILPILLSLAAGPSLCSGWQPYDEYVQYPVEAQGLLDNNVKALKDSAQNIPVDVYLTWPNKDDNTIIHFQETAVRNAPLMNLNPRYILTDGLTMGCRKAGNNAAKNSAGRVTDHTAVSKNMCNTHCTHKGRYCPSFDEQFLHDQYSDVPHNGHDLVKEVLRRVCLGKTMENGFSNPNFFNYMKYFDVDYKCLHGNKDLGDCSKRILENNLHGFDVSENSAYAKCVMESETNADTANPALEEALDFAHDLNQDKYNVYSLPVIEIGGTKMTEQPRADHIQHHWCEHFTGDTKPVSCDFCTGCSRAKNCLWHLNCDQHFFDVKTYKNPKASDQSSIGQVAATVAKDGEAVATDVAKGTGGILVGGIVIGIAVAAVLWLGVEYKRKRAIAEVAGELPRHGFKDTELQMSSTMDTADSPSKGVPEIS